MTAPQFIRTPQGEELVVLPRADYDALVASAEPYDEDADDVAIYDARKADLGGREPLPAPVTAAMLKGDSLLKALRKWRGLSQVQLAEAAGIGQGFMSELERSAKGASPDTLESLARALDVPPAWLA